MLKIKYTIKAIKIKTILPFKSKECILSLDSYGKNNIITSTSPSSWSSDISLSECSVLQESPPQEYIAKEKSNSPAKSDFSFISSTSPDRTENIFKNNNTFLIFFIILGSFLCVFLQNVYGLFNSPGRFEGSLVRLTMRTLIQRQIRTNKDCMNNIDKNIAKDVVGKAIQKQSSQKNETHSKTTRKILSRKSQNFIKRSTVNSKGLSPISKKIATFEALIQEPDFSHDLFRSLPSHTTNKDYFIWILSNKTLRKKIEEKFKLPYELKLSKNQLYNSDFTNMFQKSKTFVNNPEEVLIKILSDLETSSALTKPHISNSLNEAAKDHLLMNNHIQNPTASEILIKLQSIAYKKT